MTRRSADDATTSAIANAISRAIKKIEECGWFSAKKGNDQELWQTSDMVVSLCDAPHYIQDGAFFELARQIELTHPGWLHRFRTGAPLVDTWTICAGFNDDHEEDEVLALMASTVSRLRGEENDSDL